MSFAAKKQSVVGACLGLEVIEVDIAYLQWREQLGPCSHQLELVGLVDESRLLSIGSSDEQLTVGCVLPV